jgi:hypothetical protein
VSEYTFRVLRSSTKRSGLRAINETGGNYYDITVNSSPFCINAVRGQFLAHVAFTFYDNISEQENHSTYSAILIQSSLLLACRCRREDSAPSTGSGCRYLDYSVVWHIKCKAVPVLS